MGEVCLDGEKYDRMAFQARADYQNHAIGRMQRGYSPLGAGTVVRFPGIWMASGKCRLHWSEPSAAAAKAGLTVAVLVSRDGNW